MTLIDIRKEETQKPKKQTTFYGQTVAQKPNKNLTDFFGFICSCVILAFWA